MRYRFFAAVLALALLLYGCSAGPSVEARSVTFLAMDTVMELTAYGEGGEEAVEEAEALVHELEGLLSVTDPNSEICRADRGEAVKLSAYTEELLHDAMAACVSTGGALDVTVYPVVRAWGFTTGDYQVPDGETLAALLERVDYTRIDVRDGVLALPEGMELDLGAAAKGYAGDRIMDVFRDHGVTSAMIALGGNIQVLGTKTDGSLWRIAVRDPAGEGYAGVVEVRDGAVVTSGGYERFFERGGVRYWHIIDPSTGCPARSGLISVTVVCASGVRADCLSTALFVMGAEKAARYWQDQGGGFDFILLGENGSVTITEGLEGSFSLSGAWEGRPMEVVRR